MPKFSDMKRCSECKTELIPGSDAFRTSLCTPCSNSAALFNDSSRNVRERSLKLDAQLIEIAKLSTGRKYVDYEVSSSLWDIDPRYRSRYIKVGLSTGVVRVNIETKETSIVYPLLHDVEGHIMKRAIFVIEKAVANGTFPEKTGYASG